MPAVAKTLDRTEVALKNVDLIESDEAFASQSSPAPAKGAHPERCRRVDATGSAMHRVTRRRDRRPHPGHAQPRDDPPRRSVRPRDQVHRRRSGTRRTVRPGVMPHDVTNAPHRAAARGVRTGGHHQDLPGDLVPPW
ncbi:hypothetical protein I4I77_02810 [Pseudonocardia sp. KRD-188]|nr:hypothetical protein [Pseudonocardia oceani]